MKTIMKMTVSVLALAIAQLAIIPSGYTENEMKKHGENGNDRNELQTVTPATLPAVNTNPLPTVNTAPLPNGTALYNQYCSGCHGSSKLGKSASAIQNAIKSNKGGMGSLKSLTAAQITAIAGGVSTITSTPIQPYTPPPVPTLSPTPTPATAPAAATAKTWALYDQFCTGCHGTSKQGATAAAIQAAIKSFSQMSPLSTLTAAQIAAIAAGQ